MLDNRGFNKWAGEYDASIKRHSEGYPFPLKVIIMF